MPGLLEMLELNDFAGGFDLNVCPLWAVLWCLGFHWSVGFGGGRSFSFGCFKVFCCFLKLPIFIDAEPEIVWGSRPRVSKRDSFTVGFRTLGFQAPSFEEAAI